MQKTLEYQAISKLPSTLARAKNIIVIGSFLYSKICVRVMEKEGFRNMVNIMEPSYVIPTRGLITDVAVPKMYSVLRNLNERIIILMLFILLFLPFLVLFHPVSEIL